MGSADRGCRHTFSLLQKDQQTELPQVLARDSGRASGTCSCAKGHRVASESLGDNYLDGHHCLYLTTSSAKRLIMEGGLGDHHCPPEDPISLQPSVPLGEGLPYHNHSHLDSRIPQVKRVGAETEASEEDMNKCQQGFNSACR